MAAKQMGYSTKDIWFNKIDFFDVAVSGVVSGLTMGYGASIKAGHSVGKFGMLTAKNSGWTKLAEIGLTSGVDVTGGDGFKFASGEQFAQRVTTASITWGATELLGKIKFRKSPDRMADIRAKGLAGEEAVGINGPKTKIEVDGRNRYPDRLTENTLEEVKNVKRLSLTKQIRDYYNYSQNNGLEMILHTRSTTKISGPLQDLIDNGYIRHEIIPGF